MKKSRYSDEQIVRILREADKAPIAEVAKRHSVSEQSIYSWRKRFFLMAADAIADGHPATADKLRRASPHWMRHTHATHALQRGVELTTVRDNLCQLRWQRPRSTCIPMRRGGRASSARRLPRDNGESNHADGGIGIFGGLGVQPQYGII